MKSLLNLAMSIGVDPSRDQSRSTAGKLLSASYGKSQWFRCKSKELLANKLRETKPHKSPLFYCKIDNGQ
jgi:hypothetical protein